MPNAVIRAACPPPLLTLPAAQRTTWYGESEMGWRHWVVPRGTDVGQRSSGLNSGPDLLPGAACADTGLLWPAHCSRHTSEHSGRWRTTGTWLQWAGLIPCDRQDCPLTPCFGQWCRQHFASSRLSAPPL